MVEKNVKVSCLCYSSKYIDMIFFLEHEIFYFKSIKIGMIFALNIRVDLKTHFKRRKKNQWIEYKNDI